jgi:hypothetical protein
MIIVTLGIDLGKNSCSVVGLDESGAVVRRCHVWTPLADRGLFLALRGSSVRSCLRPSCAENLSPPALMLSADPLPSSR